MPNKNHLGATDLSTQEFVTEKVSPTQMAEPATGCYLKAIPCERKITDPVIIFAKRSVII